MLGHLTRAWEAQANRGKCVRQILDSGFVVIVNRAGSVLQVILDVLV